MRLRDQGFEVELAAGGEEALEKARTWAPDAILSDVLMPGIDGFLVCDAIRRDPSLSHIPVVLLSSAYVDEADQALAREMGANALLLRTPDFGSAIAALTTALRSGAAFPAPAIEGDREALHKERLQIQLERQLERNDALVRQGAIQAAALSVVRGGAGTGGRAPARRRCPGFLGTGLDRVRKHPGAPVRADDRGGPVPVPRGRLGSALPHPDGARQRRHPARGQRRDRRGQSADRGAPAPPSQRDRGTSLRRVPGLDPEQRRRPPRPGHDPDGGPAPPPPGRIHGGGGRLRFHRAHRGGDDRPPGAPGHQRAQGGGEAPAGERGAAPAPFRKQPPPPWGLESGWPGRRALQRTPY